MKLSLPPKLVEKLVWGLRYTFAALYAEINRSRTLIVGIYENSIVESFRGIKRTCKVCIVCLYVKKSMTTEEATCRIVGWKVTNSKMCLAPLQCMHPSKQSGSQKFWSLFFCITKQTHWIQTFTHTCTSTQKYLVQTSAKFQQWMMRDSSKPE